MADTAVAAAPVETSPKGKKAKAGTSAAKKPKVKPSHPPASKMVLAAVKELKDKKGSSLIAVKKYISANYKVDAEKLNFHIKKALKAAVAAGVLQSKGTGVTGSFKLSAKEKLSSDKPKVVKKAAKPKEAKAAKPKPAKKAAAKKPAAKKAAGEKKAAKATAKKAKATGTVKAKAAPKAKAAAKPKATKAAKKAASPKKAAAKKS